MKRVSSSAVLTLLIATTCVGLSAAPAAAAASFTCVSSDADTCVVTIPLTSNMNEQVTSTMPDTQPWFANMFGGNCPGGPGAYSITDPSWDGSDANTQGHVWAAGLTTQTGIGSGCNAEITFRHVSPGSTTPTPYKFVSISGPTTATHGSIVMITSTVKPKPPAGHVILQRKQGTAWTKLATLTFSAARHAWQVKLRWPAPKHSTWSLRVLAAATKTLSATPSAAIKVRTTG